MMKMTMDDGSDSDNSSNNNNTCMSFPFWTSSINSNSLLQRPPQPPSSKAAASTSSEVEGEIDAVTAKELVELTPKERGQLYEEIHGVADLPEETPDLIEECLSQMEDEISKIRRRSDYNKALFLDPHRVKDSAFRLMFLRSTVFDPIAAAKKMVQYFESKAELFGKDKVAKIITLEDFDEDDKTALRAGAMQFWPEPDRAGRAVCFLSRKYYQAKTWKNQLRAQWYLLSLALEDESIQRHGVVLVLYDVGVLSHTNVSKDIVKKASLLRDGLPIRVVCNHYCYDNHFAWSIVSLLRTLGGPDFRLRFRGSHQECMYSLSTFGINSEYFPVDENEVLRTEYLSRFLEFQRNKEEQNSQKGRYQELVTVTENDVLLGRGRPSQDHSGNQQLGRLIDQRQSEYYKADRFGKVLISWDIVRIVQQDLGGRFLERDAESGEWQPCSDEVARRKTAYGFRTGRKHKIKLTS